MRYLTKKDTTYILYFRNGTGFSPGEMRDYFTLINKGYDTYVSTGSDASLKKGGGHNRGQLRQARTP